MGSQSTNMMMVNPPHKVPRLIVIARSSISRTSLPLLKLSGTSCTGRPRGKGSTAATRELHVTELSIAMLISIFFDNVTTHQQRCVLVLNYSSCFYFVAIQTL